MRVLIAEDETVSRRLLHAFLTKWGYDDVVMTADGAEALEVLRQPDAPGLAIIDWMMPKIDGLEVCQRARALGSMPTYFIMLTAKSRIADAVTALEAGVDDYVVKPFDQAELRARVHVGARIVDLQTRLAGRVAELESALARVNQLEGLIPICSYCKRVRSDSDYWEQVEGYISAHSNARFTHSICPTCFDRVSRQLPPAPDPAP